MVKQGEGKSVNESARAISNSFITLEKDSAESKKLPARDYVSTLHNGIIQNKHSLFSSNANPISFSSVPTIFQKGNSAQPIQLARKLPIVDLTLHDHNDKLGDGHQSGADVTAKEVGSLLDPNGREPFGHIAILRRAIQVFDTSIQLREAESQNRGAASATALTTEDQTISNHAGRIEQEKRWRQDLINRLEHIQVIQQRNLIRSETNERSGVENERSKVEKEYGKELERLQAMDQSKFPKLG